MKNLKLFPLLMIAVFAQASTIFAEETYSWQFWKKSKGDQEYIDLLRKTKKAKDELNDREQKTAEQEEEEYLQKKIAEDFFPNGRDNKRDYWWLSDDAIDRLN